MPKTIYKYPLCIQDTFKVMVPSGARLLSVQNQGDIICAWFEVTPDNTPETWTFTIYGTGHTLDQMGEDTVFVGSVQQGKVRHGGYRFVWHIYRDLMPHEPEFKEREASRQQTAAELVDGVYGEFLQGYTVTAIETGKDRNGEPLDDSFNDMLFDSDTHAQFDQDCRQFFKSCYDEIVELLFMKSYEFRQVGEDFWLSRNGLDRSARGFDTPNYPRGIRERLLAEARKFPRIRAVETLRGALAIVSA